MPRTFSKRLVIDASIAQASGGEEATFPTSKRCRDFLKEVLRICHRVVWTEETISEWNRHQSNFARNWRVTMKQKGKDVVLGDPLNQPLRQRLDDIAESENQRQAMQKDCCLIEAALKADQTVVSLDENARRLFASASASVDELKNVVWVNPDKQEENCPTWLSEGAKPESARRLGNYPNE